jgi:nicotinamidase-related amidase
MNATGPPPATVAATPYPWPFDGIDPMALACVVVGWDSGWAARTTATAETTAAIATVATTVVAAGGHLVTVAHRHRHAPAMAPPPSGPDPRLAPDKSPLLHPPGVPAWGDAVTAGGNDGFFASSLDAVLRHHRRHQLVIVGHGLEGPVHSTLRSANDRGYECLLVIDACTPICATLARAARKTVEMSGGIFGAVTTTAELTRDLHATAGAGPVPSRRHRLTAGDPPIDPLPRQGAPS